MREIKFRGRGAYQRSIWYVGDLVRCDDGRITIRENEANEFYVDPATVGQFTRLKDSEGREIYEGDIVRVVHYGEESIHTVKYYDDINYPAFDLDPDLDSECNGLAFCKCAFDTTITVIGNVHDNPELLENAR